jgi:hypothetical protein
MSRVAQCAVGGAPRRQQSAGPCGSDQNAGKQWLTARLAGGITWRRITMKGIVIAIFSFLATCASAQTPLFKVALTGDTTFQLESGGTFTVYPLGERMRPIVQESRRRLILAVDYATGTRIRTLKPGLAVQNILQQIGAQTGLSLGSFIDTTAAAGGVTIVTGVSERSVWTVVLTSAGRDTYNVTISYVIDAKAQPAATR